jgi:hypothetical protein
MSRPRLAIGTFGDIGTVRTPGGRYTARARYRDWDGKTRLVEATGETSKAASQALKQKLTSRALFQPSSTVPSGEARADHDAVPDVREHERKSEEDDDSAGYDLPHRLGHAQKCGRRLEEQGERNDRHGESGGDDDGPPPLTFGCCACARASCD